MLHRTERFVLWLLTVGLILLVSIQMMMTNEEARAYLQVVEGRIQSLIRPEARPVSLVEAEEHVTFKLLNKGSFSKARVIINSEQAFYFQQSALRVPVNSGDFLILDTRGISDALWFEVVDVSQGISSVKVGQQYRVCNGLEVVPVETVQASKM